LMNTTERVNNGGPSSWQSKADPSLYIGSATVFTPASRAKGSEAIDAIGRYRSSAGSDPALPKGSGAASTEELPDAARGAPDPAVTADSAAVGDRGQPHLSTREEVEALARRNPQPAAASAL